MLKHWRSSAQNGWGDEGSNRGDAYIYLEPAK